MIGIDGRALPLANILAIKQSIKGEVALYKLPVIIVSAAKLLAGAVLDDRTYFCQR
jgi:hypothetical protein